METTKQIKQHLKSLVDTCNDGCKQAYKSGIFRACSVGCMEALYCIDQDGDESYKILIDGGDEATDLLTFVTRYLKEHGLVADIRSEW